MKGGYVKGRVEKREPVHQDKGKHEIQPKATRIEKKGDKTTSRPLREYRGRTNIEEGGSLKKTATNLAERNTGGLG